MKKTAHSTSKPKTHHGRADRPSPSTYVVKKNPGAKPGEWQGSYQPSTATQKKALKELRKMHAAIVPGAPGIY
jgi:hypothetical protein